MKDRHRAYSVLVKNVNDDAELASIGAVVDHGNAADLDETLEHLEDRRDGERLGPPIFDLLSDPNMNLP
jgi:hypothetical protein